MQQTAKLKQVHLAILLNYAIINIKFNALKRYKEDENVFIR